MSYAESYKRDRNWYIEGRLNYDRTFGDHKVSALFLYNQSRNYYPLYADGTVASFQYLPRGYVGFVGRATYGYKSRYLADVNMGYNGSENFAPGKPATDFSRRLHRLGAVGRAFHEELAMA
ncbi:hypothetical protein SFC43_22560 [Bacteroides sp. CR5/BHMF/2]|nr:hypothetical protein [Bacteroides sp. CR5/BHMF/2]